MTGVQTCALPISLFSFHAERNKIKEPIFCIPGAGDNVTSFIELSSCVDKRLSVHGLQPRGLDSKLVPHSTARAASELYLRSITELYPEGPIHLLGHSFGGWVAFDMAQRLLDAGRRISSLIILDSEAPDTQNAPIREYTPSEVIIEMANIFALTVGHTLSIIKEDLENQTEIRQAEILHRCLINEGIMTSSTMSEVLLGPIRAFAMALRSHYTPTKPYPGLVQLVLAEDDEFAQSTSPQTKESTLEGWRLWAPNLVYVQARGNHITMLKPPHLHNLVQRLKLA